MVLGVISPKIIGKMIDNSTYKGFAVRSFVSTAVAQWVDNFVFSALVSKCIDRYGIKVSSMEK